MTRRIIGLTGYARVGKDVVADHLVTAHGFTRVAFADALKEMALDINPVLHFTPDEGDPVYLADLVTHFGWDSAKLDPDVRRLLQSLGVAVRRRDPDFWVRQVDDLVQESRNDIVVTDVRFPNEAAWLRRVSAAQQYTIHERSFGNTAHGGGLYDMPVGKLVRVTRPGVGPVNDHESETALEGVPVDPVLENRGSVEDLRALVDAVLV